MEKLHLWLLHHNRVFRSSSDGKSYEVRRTFRKTYVLTRTTDVSEAKTRLEKDLGDQTTVESYGEAIYLGEVVNDVGHELGFLEG